MFRVVVSIVFLMCVNVALACSCFNNDGLEERVKKDYAYSSVVVMALANSIEKLKPVVHYNPNRPPDTEYMWHKTKFTTLKSWKGIHETTFYTETSIESSACGYQFEIGKTYLLYLTETNAANTFTTSSCSETKPVDKNTDNEVQILNKIHLTSRSSGQPQPALLRSIAPVRYVARFALHSAA